MVFRRPEAPTITVHDITVRIYPFEHFEEGCFTGVGRDLALLQSLHACTSIPWYVLKTHV